MVNRQNNRLEEENWYLEGSEMRIKLTGSFPSIASIHNFLSASERAWKVTGVFLWKQNNSTIKNAKIALK